MPRPPTGHHFERDGKRFARVTVAPRVRRTFHLPHCRTPGAAAERSKVLATLARRLRAAGLPEDRRVATLGFVAEAGAGELQRRLASVEKLIAGTLPIPGETRSTAPTFGEVARQWTTGELNRRFPQLRRKKSWANEESHLRCHILPVLRDVPIDLVTLDHCDDVMGRLPEGMESGSKANIARTLGRVLRLAVYPLRLREASPIPPGFVPPPSRRKALAYLYPAEDAQLLGCAEVPLGYRLLWGFYVREGMRPDEARSLTWADLDLERGAVRLDENKTDDPRSWPLDPGVAAALRAYRERYRPDAEREDLVFVDPKGRPHKAWAAAQRLRDHLDTAGVKRPELFETSGARRKVRAHDLRGTFVTLHLAAGRSESWIMDRTGHQDSRTMLTRYKRVARTAAELDLGPLVSLAEGIPELRGKGTKRPKQPQATETIEGTEMLRKPRHDSEVRETPTFSEDRGVPVDDRRPSSGRGALPGAKPDGSGGLNSALGSAPPWGNTDPTAERLRALRAAAEDAGRWDEAEALSVALRAHLRSVQAAERAEVVVDLESRRERR